MYTKLEVDVHCHWSEQPPVYRIYVNDEMLVERLFGWAGHQTYLKEHLFCDLDTGVHVLKLENLGPKGEFSFSKFLVNNTEVNKNLLKVKENDIEWRFIVDNLLANNTSN